jgi:16S rRNA (guanine966-N2)-methyltransferase
MGVASVVRMVLDARASGHDNRFGPASASVSIVHLETSRKHSMPRKPKSGKSSREARGAEASGRDPDVRIIGGQFRGRRLRYHGDPVVRPMKHRTREAIFNLVTTDAVGRHVIDLFAGTGALGLEALSRGAVGATFIEKHVPSARVIEENIRTLDVADRATLLVTSAFLWAKRDLPSAAETSRQAGVAWLVFCSPPYAFYDERREEMLELVRHIQQRAPAGSVLVVEADERFDFELLRGDDTRGEHGEWDARSYQPAVVGIWRKP